MWSLLPKFSLLGLSSQGEATEPSIEDRPPCENALIAVLPLFAFKVRMMKELSNVDPVASNDDYARKLQSFAVSYEMEAGMLRDNLEDMVDLWGKSEGIESEEYTEALTDILLLFEGQISLEVLDVNHRGCLVWAEFHFILSPLSIRDGRKYPCSNLGHHLRSNLLRDEYFRY